MISVLDSKSLEDFLTRLGFSRNVFDEPAGEFFINSSGLTFEGLTSRVTFGSETNVVFGDFSSNLELINIRFKGQDRKLLDLIAKAHDLVGSPLDFRSLILSSLDILRGHDLFFSVLDHDYWYRLNYRRPRVRVGDSPWEFSEVKIIEIDHNTGKCELSTGEWYSLGVIHATSLKTGTRYLDWRLTSSTLGPPVLEDRDLDVLLYSALNFSGPYRDVDYRPFIFESERSIRSSQVVI